MSHLPKTWSTVPLGEVATLQRGFDLPVQDRRPGTVPIFAANGPVGTHSEAMVQGPGVVTGRSGTLGEVHYVESDFWPLNTSLWVKDFHGNDPRWVSRLLAWMRLQQFTRGAGVPTLNRNLVHVVEVPLPPLPEQRRIAAILGKADDIRRKRAETLRLADEFLKSAFLDMFGDPVTNPKGWPERRLDALAEIRSGITKGRSFGEQRTVQVPYMRVASVQDGYLDLSDVTEIEVLPDEIPGYRLESGDLLLTEGGDPDKLG